MGDAAIELSLPFVGPHWAEAAAAPRAVDLIKRAVAESQEGCCIGNNDPASFSQDFRDSDNPEMTERGLLQSFRNLVTQMSAFQFPCTTFLEYLLKRHLRSKLGSPRLR